MTEVSEFEDSGIDLSKDIGRGDYVKIGEEWYRLVYGGNNDFHLVNAATGRHRRTYSDSAVNLGTIAEDELSRSVSAICRSEDAELMLSTRGDR